MPGNKWPPQIQRFRASCSEPKETGCIEWTGNRTKNGYGLFQFDHTATTAHRWHYMHAYGKLDRSTDVMHACDNRLCVNLDHLSAGTRKQNMDDMKSKGRGTKGKPRPSMQGQNHHQAVLTVAQVLDIRRRHAEGEPMRSLATEFDVSFQSISRIVRRISWGNI